MWEQQILEIRNKREKRGKALNSPASNEQIEILIKTAKKEFNHILPEQYINFLKAINGLEFNGFIFYGIDNNLLEVDTNQRVIGYVDSNEIWYDNEDQKQYMFFGDSNISWYCFDLSKEVYVELDKPSGTLMHTYNDFNEMLEKALNDSLL